MNFENLSSERKDKLKEAKSLEDMEKIAAEEGFELSDEQLDAIAGGIGGGIDCPKDYCCPSFLHEQEPVIL